MPEFRAIQYCVENGIVKITLNRPAKRNAVNLEMVKELIAGLRQAKEDPEVRAVVITGAGESFCSGIDLAFFRDVKPLEFRTFLGNLYGELTDIQHNLGKPTIAALNGPTMAAGCTIAFSCDLIIASEKATIGYPEVNVGLIPGLHLVLLPRLIGRYKALELCLTGEAITAQEALDLGMINRVVAHDDLNEKANDFAKKLAVKSPLAVKLCKEAFYRNMDIEFKKAVMDTADVLCLAKGSEDAYEGVSAFVEKRLPVWKGK